MSNHRDDYNRFSVWGFIKGFGKLIIGFLLLLQGLMGLVLLLLIVGLWAQFTGALGGNQDQAKYQIEEGTAFVLNPVGVLVEDAPERDELAAAISGAYGVSEPTMISLHDVIKTIRAAKDDSRISAMVMDIGTLAVEGTSKAYTLIDEIEAFKEGGKKVYATSSFYRQTQYLIASHADEIILNDAGGVSLTGYGVFNNYYKSLLDKLKITNHVFRVGTYKAAVEPSLRDDMSEAAKEANLEFVTSFWDRYIQEVGGVRDLDPAVIHNYADTYNTVLREYGGDSARAALAVGLVDKVYNSGQLRQFLQQTFGKGRGRSIYKGIPYQAYLKSLSPPVETTLAGKSYVAVITAAGTIVPGRNQSSGVAASGPIVDYLLKAKDDDNVKAVVLRVDSPGGSAFASELIHNAILEVKAAGKPVIISMGSLAASGGYLIAAPGDEIWAAPTTITGSIGVFATFFTFENLATEAGVFTDGVGTTSQSALTATGVGALPEVTADALQAGVEHGYERFLNIVAKGRGLERDYVDSVGQGRIWTGEKALELKLVDKLGTYEDAIKAAASKAELSDYTVIRYEDRRTPFERIISGNTAQIITKTGLDKSLAAAVPLSNSNLGDLLQNFDREISDLKNYNDPAHLYTRCLECEALPQR